MTFELLLKALKKRALLILTVAVACVLVAVAVGMLRSPLYTARTTVRVLLDTGIPDLNVRIDYHDRLLSSYAYLIKTRPLLEKAIAQAAPGSNLSVDDVSQSVDAQVVPGTDLIDITVQNSQAGLARDLANALGMELIDLSQERSTTNGQNTAKIMETQLASVQKQLNSDRQQLDAETAKGATADTTVLRDRVALDQSMYDRLVGYYQVASLTQLIQLNSISIAQPAVVPVKPSNGLGLKEILLSLVLGLFAGVALALILETLNPPVRAPERLHESPATIIQQRSES